VRSWPRSRALAGAVVTLVVHLWLTNSAARAACGDYVTFGRAAEMQAHIATVPADKNGKHQQAPASPRPCSGPHCSRAPAAPSPAPAVPPTSQEQQSAVSPLSIVVAANNSRELDLEGRAPQLSQFALRIFHPPR
jgi:hypothetical protein